MKIAILAPYSRPWDGADAEGSGMNTFIRESAEAFAQEGHDVTVYRRQSRDKDNEHYIHESGVREVTIHAGSSERFSRELVFDLCKQPIEIEVKRNIERADIVIAHHYISYAWIRQLNLYSKPLVYFSHAAIFNPKRNSVCANIHLIAESFFAQRALWGAQSTEEFAYMSDVLDPQRLFLVYPGVNVTRNSGAKKDIILFVGRNCDAKGADIFDALAKRHPECAFVAIGRDVDQLSSGIERKKYMPLLELSALIEEARVVVCPSRYEHFGLVPVMATKLGTCVLASRCGSAANCVLDGVNGVLYEVEDEIGAAFNKAIDLSKGGYASLAVEAEQVFNWKKFVEQTIDAALSPRKVFTGKVLEVGVEPKLFNNVLIPYEYAQLKGSVHVIPKTKEGNFLFIKERKPHHPDEYRLKLVSGICESNDPTQDAIRELQEEIGLVATTIRPLISIDRKDAIRDARYYFIAEGLTETSHAHEETEDIQEVVELDVDTIRKYLVNGEFGISVATIALLKLLKEEGGEL